MERNKRKTFEGVVGAINTEKTISVVIETKKKHPLYGKQIKYTKKYPTHDENSIAKVGDIVLIMETRPLSKTKKWRLVKVIKSVSE